jgi:hypothetical protein
MIKMTETDYPQEVYDIIEYTKLRKKYPKKDKELRTGYSFNQKESITKKQMYVLLRILRNFDSNGSKTKCEMCHKRYNPDEDMDEKDPDYVETKNYCPECRKVMAMKYRKDGFFSKLKRIGGKE